jgi:hypothetical protein
MAPVKQGRHDLRQLGLALVVDQDTQLPLAYVLYEGARSDMHTFRLSKAGMRTAARTDLTAPTVDASV